MSNMDDLYRVEGLSINDETLITGGVIDPSVDGYEAPLGSLYLRTNIVEAGKADTGKIYLKTGVLDTAWAETGNQILGEIGENAEGKLTYKGVVIDTDTHADLTPYRTSADQDIIDNAQNVEISKKVNAVAVYTKTEVDSKLNDRVKKSGDNMSGALTFTDPESMMAYTECKYTPTSFTFKTNTGLDLESDNTIHLKGDSIMFDASPVTLGYQDTTAYLAEAGPKSILSKEQIEAYIASTSYTKAAVDASQAAQDTKIEANETQIANLANLIAGDNDVAGVTWDEATRTLTITKEDASVSTFVIGDQMLGLVDELTSNDGSKALSAKQGKILREMIEAQAITNSESYIVQVDWNEATRELTVSKGDSSTKTIITKTEVVDNTTDTDSDKALSVNQGTILRTDVNNRLRTNALDTDQQHVKGTVRFDHRTHNGHFVDIVGDYGLLRTQKYPGLRGEYTANSIKYTNPYGKNLTFQMTTGDTGGVTVEGNVPFGYNPSMMASHYETLEPWSYITREYVESSKGCLITNGSGELGTTYNWYNTETHNTDLPIGFATGFKNKGYAPVRPKELIPIGQHKNVKLSVLLKGIAEDHSPIRTYVGYMFFDRDKQVMYSQDVSRFGHIILTQDIVEGDTVIHFNPALSEIYTALPKGGITYFGEYVDGRSVAYQNYSKHHDMNLWNSSDVDKTAGTITLLSPVANGAFGSRLIGKTTGTELSQYGSSAGTYNYSVFNGHIEHDIGWQTYEGILDGRHDKVCEWGEAGSTKIWADAAYVVPLLLLNYGADATFTTLWTGMCMDFVDDGSIEAGKLGHNSAGKLTYNGAIVDTDTHVDLTPYRTSAEQDAIDNANNVNYVVKNNGTADNLTLTGTPTTSSTYASDADAVTAVNDVLGHGTDVVNNDTLKRYVGTTTYSKSQVDTFNTDMTTSIAEKASSDDVNSAILTLNDKNTAQDTQITNLANLIAGDNDVAGVTWDEATRTLTITKEDATTSTFVIGDQMVALADDLVTNDATKALSAKQGVELLSQINDRVKKTGDTMTGPLVNKTDGNTILIQPSSATGETYYRVGKHDGSAVAWIGYKPSINALRVVSNDGHNIELKSGGAINLVSNGDYGVKIVTDVVRQHPMADDLSHANWYGYYRSGSLQGWTGIASGSNTMYIEATTSALHVRSRQSDVVLETLHSNKTSKLSWLGGSISTYETWSVDKSIMPKKWIADRDWEDDASGQRVPLKHERDYIQSSRNMIVNGSAEFGNTYNWTSSANDIEVVAPNDLPEGLHSAFKSTAQSPTITSDELIYLNGSDYIKADGFIRVKRADDANVLIYSGLMPFDVDDKFIASNHVYSSGNLILTQDIAAGDTVIHFDPAQSSLYKATQSYACGFSFFGEYADSNGHVYEDYTRYQELGLWANGHVDIDTTAGTITLTNPLPAESRLVGKTIGTKLWQSYSGGTFQYFVDSSVYLKESQGWVHSVGEMKGFSTKDQSAYHHHTKIRSGTHSFKSLLLANYGTTDSETYWTGVKFNTVEVHTHPNLPDLNTIALVDNTFSFHGQKYTKEALVWDGAFATTNGQALPTSWSSLEVKTAARNDEDFVTISADKKSITVQGTFSRIEIRFAKRFGTNRWATGWARISEQNKGWVLNVSDKQIGSYNSKEGNQPTGSIQIAAIDVNPGTNPIYHLEMKSEKNSSKLYDSKDGWSEEHLVIVAYK